MRHKFSDYEAFENVEASIPLVCRNWSQIITVNDLRSKDIHGVKSLEILAAIIKATVFQFRACVHSSTKLFHDSTLNPNFTQLLIQTFPISARETDPSKNCYCQTYSLSSLLFQQLSSFFLVLQVTFSHCTISWLPFFARILPQSLPQSTLTCFLVVISSLRNVPVLCVPIENSFDIHTG